MAQEAFIRLYESLPRYESKAPARALLATIIRNACLTSLKREKKVVVSEEAQQIAEETLVARDGQPDTAPEAPEAERVMRVLGTLSNAQGEAIRLRYFSDLTYDEIGAAMGITRNHVGVLLHQALARIRQRLGHDP
jgi:RNA polymerase sigma-70 factor (ECF subfamily)